MDQRLERKSKLRKRIKRKKIKNITKLIFISLFIALGVVFILDTFFVSVLNVEGDSMQKTLYQGDKLIVSKFGISTNKLKSDDIVYFKGSDDKYYIKRIVAVPGDVVEIVNGIVLVNGIQKIENYIIGNKTETYNQNKWFVEENEFFVLGDNRTKNSSKDSRVFGNIKISQIKGKVIHNFSSER